MLSSRSPASRNGCTQLGARPFKAMAGALSTLGASAVFLVGTVFNEGSPRDVSPGVFHSDCRPLRTWHHSAF